MGKYDAELQELYRDGFHARLRDLMDMMNTAHADAIGFIEAQPDGPRGWPRKQAIQVSVADRISHAREAVFSAMTAMAALPPVGRKNVYDTRGTLLGWVWKDADGWLLQERNRDRAARGSHPDEASAVRELTRRTRGECWVFYGTGANRRVVAMVYRDGGHWHFRRTALTPEGTWSVDELAPERGPWPTSLDASEAVRAEVHKEEM